jgi:hypothetical protein
MFHRAGWDRPFVPPGRSEGLKPTPRRTGGRTRPDAARSGDRPADPPVPAGPAVPVQAGCPAAARYVSCAILNADADVADQSLRRLPGRGQRQPESLSAADRGCCSATGTM